MHKLFTVCTEQVRSPYIEHAASGLPNPTHLEGEVRFDQAQDQQVVTTRSPRIVTGCLLTLLMLIKMYVYAIFILYAIYILRGAMVEWLERLAVVRKVAGSSPARAKRLENSHCPPSSEWVSD